ncbi:MAG TPA: hypothetical protein VKE94_21420 [Gemmataceae bacterium]|nr:hypothetical protein [Gemmataceae bacterium]
MATIQRLGLTDVIVFGMLLAVAAGVRVWFLSIAADNGTTIGPLRVQDARPPAPADTNPRGRSTGTELDVLAGNLKDKNQFACRPPFAQQVEETAHVSPGYPYFLSLLDRVSDGPDKADQVARWLQAGLGALTAGLYFVIALVAFRSRVVAILAGLFCAAHPFWIVNAADIDDGVVATFLLALALFLGTRGGIAGGALTSLLFGLSLAALALFRAALLPFAFVALLWYVMRCRSVPRGWLSAVLSVLGFANGLAPWAVRNWQAYREPMPIVDSAYFHLWMGSNPRADGGPMNNYELHTAMTDEAKQRLNQQTSRREIYQTLGEETLKAVSDDPGGCLRQRIQALLTFLFGQSSAVFRVGGGGGLVAKVGDVETMPQWLCQNLELVFYGSTCVVIFLGVVGWRWTYAWRRESRLLALATIFVPLPYILSHAEALVGPRLPLDGVLLTFAAYALACLVPGVGVALFPGPEGVEVEAASRRRLHQDEAHDRF